MYKLKSLVWSAYTVLVVLNLNEGVGVQTGIMNLWITLKLLNFLASLTVTGSTDSFSERHLVFGFFIQRIFFSTK
jgi:hypothetical protein